jgi:hypothetical protein
VGKGWLNEEVFDNHILGSFDYNYHRYDDDYYSCAK